jgi:hypothetical protein
MDGVAIVRAVLVADAALIALVPAARIMAGVLPQGTTLPGIALQSISIVDRNIPNPGAYRHVQERVQATILAKTDVSRTAVKLALRKALDAKYPTVSGVIRATVHLGLGGPEFINEEASQHLVTQDLMTTYSVAR